MKTFLSFCRTIGKLLQTSAMAEAKLFSIKNVTKTDLKAVQDYIDANDLPVEASFDANDAGPNQRLDKQGKPYPPSILISFDNVNIDGWE